MQTKPSPRLAVNTLHQPVPVISMSKNSSRPSRMSIVVTGASGFVGQNLVPLLSEAGAKLLLVGRDTQRLHSLFPDQDACSYDALEEAGKGFDLLVHLAVMNNRSDGSPDAFHAANVELLVNTVEAAKRAGIRRFLNISSFHALDPKNLSPYAQSKREANRRVQGIQGIEVTTVFLPYVHASKWGGKLRFLNALPAPAASAIFQILAAWKPTVHISRLADYILGRSGRQDTTECLLSDGQLDNGVYKAVKRIVDLAFALAVAALFWWGLLLIWAAVRMQSPGPGIFAQERIGRNGKTFTCYKFRTMKLGTVQAATNEVSAQAITGIGHFLRKTKLDELPQIWNILRNEISLVGPRPCLPGQRQLVEARNRLGVLQLTPGISGLAQVNDIDMSEPERLAQWDARYLALQSLSMDLNIILSTAMGRGRGDRVLRNE